MIIGRDTQLYNRQPYITQLYKSPLCWARTQEGERSLHLPYLMPVCDPHTTSPSFDTPLLRRPERVERRTDAHLPIYILWLTLCACVFIIMTQMRGSVGPFFDRRAKRGAAGGHVRACVY